MRRAAEQSTLFDTQQSLPNGFVYRPDFLTREEEAELLSYIPDLPLKHGEVDGYLSKRRMMGFGWRYDFANEKLVPGPPLPPFLTPYARKIAKWLNIPLWRVAEALIIEYPPGAAIGWHRDNETFEHIIGVSLVGWCRFRLRPIASRMRRRRHPKDVIALPIEPRSAYIMQKESRWLFQHSVAPVETLRYSITFRTLPAGVAVPKRRG